MKKTYAKFIIYATVICAAVVGIILKIITNELSRGQTITAVIVLFVLGLFLGIMLGLDIGEKTESKEKTNKNEKK